jgi:hypothetical protein
VSKPKKEDEGSKVVDRRKAARKKAAASESGKANTPQPEDVASEQTETKVEPEAEPQAETQAERPPEQIPAFDTYSILRWCIGLMTAQAWQWMGLVANPVSGEVKKDLKQARLSIDSVAALTELLSPNVEPDERRELENLVSNLRLNFVNQSQQTDNQ